MNKVVTAIAELPEELLQDWREWVEANGGKVLTPRYMTEGEKDGRKHISEISSKND